MRLFKLLTLLIIAGLYSGTALAQNGLPMILQFKKGKPPAKVADSATYAGIVGKLNLKLSQRFKLSSLKLEDFTVAKKDSLLTGSASDDPATIKLINQADSVKKIEYTNKFLTTTTKPIAFKIGQVGLYNIDTLNKYIYNQGAVSGLQSAAIENFSGEHTYISAELGSFLFGPVRMGVSGVFQTKGDTSKDNAIKSSIQKIVSNGGAINLSFLLPLYFSRSRNEQVHFAIFAQMNNGINPGVDSTGTTDYSTNLSYTNQSGFDFHFDVGSNDKKARLSFDVPLYYSVSTSNLRAQSGLPDYFLARAQIGAILGDLLNFHISGPLLSSASKVQHTPWVISLQFSPAQLIGSK